MGSKLNGKAVDHFLVVRLSGPLVDTVEKVAAAMEICAWSVSPFVAADETGHRHVQIALIRPTDSLHARLDSIPQSRALADTLEFRAGDSAGSA